MRSDIIFDLFAARLWYAPIFVTGLGAGALLIGWGFVSGSIRTVVPPGRACPNCRRVSP